MKRVVSIAVVILLAGFAVHAWKPFGVSAVGPDPAQRSEAQSEQSALQVDDLNASLRALSGPRPESRQRNQTIPASLPMAPPVGSPLTASLATLTERADRGDAPAKCRLAVELGLCANSGRAARSMLGTISGQVAGSKNQDLTFLESVEISFGQLEELQQHCGEEPLSDATEREFRWQQAAEHGSARTRVLFALRGSSGHITRLIAGPGIRFFTDRRPMASQYYAEHAVEFLNQGLAVRDPLALEGLILLHEPRQGAGFSPLPISWPNPLRYATYVGLWERLGFAALPASVLEQREQALASLDPSLLPQLQRLIGTEAARWQAGSKPLAMAPVVSVETVDQLCPGS